MNYRAQPQPRSCHEVVSVIWSSDDTRFNCLSIVPLGCYELHNIFWSHALDQKSQHQGPNMHKKSPQYLTWLEFRHLTTIRLILYRVGTHAIALLQKKKRTCLIGTRSYAQLEVDWMKERGSIKSTGYFTDAVVFNSRGRGDGKSPFQEMRSVSTAVKLESWFLSEEGKMEMGRDGLTDYDWDTLRVMRIGMW